MEANLSRVARPQDRVEEATQVVVPDAARGQGPEGGSIQRYG